MPNHYNTEGDRIVDRPKSPEAARQFEPELKAMVEGLRNHPSIIMWTLFNEAWGQYDSYRLTRWIKGMDPTRLVNTASGFVFKGCGDVMDSHGGVPPFMPGLAMVTSETAGFGVVMKEHSWMPARGWAYGAYRPGGGTAGGRGQQAADWTPEAKAWYTDRTVNWITDFHRQQVADGRTGSIKVQLTDVETECNGLLTYDRAIIKVDAEKVAAASLDNSEKQ
jgi:hypothetical protein